MQMSSLMKFGLLIKFGICIKTLILFVTDEKRQQAERRKKIRIENDTDSTSSTLSTRAIQSIVDNLKTKRFRSSTKRNYYAVWHLFNEFFIRLDEKPDNWEDRIILFAGYLIDNDKKSNTVKSYVSAIKAVLRDNNIEVNEDRYLLNSLTKACRYQNDTVHTRLPIRKNLLQLMLTKLPQVFKGEQPYLVIMYRALLLTAYFGLFRVGEVTMSQHVLKAKDVEISDHKKKLKFILRSSKTTWTDQKPQTIKISSQPIDINPRPNTINKFCPFQAMEQYINMRQQTKVINEQCFVFQNGAPVKAHHLRHIIKETLKKCKLDPSLYRCHSTHAGRAIDLVELYKLDVATVKNLGRWQSNIVYQYLKH